MVIKADFEIQDLDGETIHYSSTVGTTPITVPSVAGKIISEFWIENSLDNSPVTKRLEFSCDGGVTYTSLRLGESMNWTPKGRIRLLYIKASAASTSYSMIVNYEDI